MGNPSCLKSTSPSLKTASREAHPFYRDLIVIWRSEGHYYFPSYVIAPVFDCDLYCRESSRWVLCSYNVGISTLLAPSRLVATEPMFVSYHRATCESSVATLLPFLTKIVATAPPKGLVAHKVQKSPNGHYIYDAISKRLRGLRPLPDSSDRGPYEGATTLQIEGLWGLAQSPSSRLLSYCDVKPA